MKKIPRKNNNRQIIELKAKSIFIIKDRNIVERNYLETILLAKIVKCLRNLKPSYNVAPDTA